MSSTQLTESDEGKRVVSADGDGIGRIIEVRDGTAYVDPDPSMIDSVKAKLDWGDVDDDTYPLGPDHVSNVTDDEVRIR